MPSKKLVPCPLSCPLSPFLKERGTKGDTLKGQTRQKGTPNRTKPDTKLDNRIGEARDKTTND